MPEFSAKAGESNGGQGRNRTADTAIFRRATENEEAAKVGAFSGVSERCVAIDVG